MIKGTEVDLGGTVFIVPPLNLAALERFQTKLASYTGGIDSESVAFVVDVAYAAIKRNYPDITVDELKELIDLGNIREIFGAVMNISGLVAKDGAPGEALAPATA